MSSRMVKLTPDTPAPCTTTAGANAVLDYVLVPLAHAAHLRLDPSGALQVHPAAAAPVPVVVGYTDASGAGGFDELELAPAAQPA